MGKDSTVLRDLGVPVSKRQFYYWLCENLSIRAANLWLDGYWQEFIDHVRDADL